MATTTLLHDIASAAEMLSMGRTSVYEEIKAGRIAVVKIGRRSLIKHSELERFVDALGAAPRTA